MKITTEHYSVDTVPDKYYPHTSVTTITRLIDGRVLYCDLPVATIGAKLPELDSYLDKFMDVGRYPHFKTDNRIKDELVSAYNGLYTENVSEPE